jgi:nucleoid-associated protein EbfC
VSTTGEGSQGTPDFGALMQQAQQMQEQLMATQAELAEARVEGSAGAGLVTATVTGTGDLDSLTIAPEAADPADTDTLADLVVAAIRDAQANAQRMVAERLGPLAELGQKGGSGTPDGGPGGKLGF